MRLYKINMSVHTSICNCIKSMYHGTNNEDYFNFSNVKFKILKNHHNQVIFCAPKGLRAKFYLKPHKITEN
jgi:hypothetical protein